MQIRFNNLKILAEILIFIESLFYLKNNLKKSVYFCVLQRKYYIFATTKLNKQSVMIRVFTNKALKVWNVIGKRNFIKGAILFGLVCVVFGSVVALLYTMLYLTNTYYNVRKRQFLSGSYMRR